MGAPLSVCIVLGQNWAGYLQVRLYSNFDHVGSCFLNALIKSENTL
jgi:hypothetical protein